VPDATRADIDRILEAIRAEAKARGSKARVGGYPVDPGAAAAAPAGTHGAQMLAPTHAADYLAMPLDVFLTCAYRGALGRDPDSHGAEHYQRMLLRGKLTRIEVLGRLSLSGEGRQSGQAIPGIFPAFFLATAYRIPLVGPAAALLARLLGLPEHWQDRSRLEAAALATGAWMKR
jgi:hypothetical protein